MQRPPNLPLTLAQQKARTGEEPLWVFAYGSLMWRPGFVFAERVPAVLHGWHRSLCILSLRYRGTPTQPGVVLGLDRGGSCTGIAYRIAPEHRREAVEYLDDRELDMDCYHPRFARLRLCDGRVVESYLYVADRQASQYAGALSLQERLALLRHGVGEVGSSRDYLEQTLVQLAALGVRDGALHRLLRALEEGEPSS